jgi:hypothetical protein
MLGMVRARRIAVPHERQIWSGCSRSIKPQMPIFRRSAGQKRTQMPSARDAARRIALNIVKVLELLLGMESRVSNFAQTPSG